MRRAIVARERKTVSVCQSVGPSYLGIGAPGTGPNSYIERRATRWDLKGSVDDIDADAGGCSASEVMVDVVMGEDEEHSPQAIRY